MSTNKLKMKALWGLAGNSEAALSQKWWAAMCQDRNMPPKLASFTDKHLDRCHMGHGKALCTELIVLSVENA